MALVYKVSKAHNNILGKSLTPDEIAIKVAELFLGNEDKRIEPHNISQISKAIGYTSRGSIYRFMKRAVKLKLLEKNGERFVKSKISPEQEFKQFSKEHPILNDPLVAEWYEDLQLRKKGKGVKIRDNLINQIERLCNTCHVTPSQIIESKTNAEILKKNYLTAYLEHRVVSKNKISYKANIDNIDYTMSYAIASFCGMFNISWARGTSKMSRQVVGHGKFAHIRLTDEELLIADSYLKEKYGMDSDIYRIFWVGIESCSRREALFGIPLDYTKKPMKNGKTTYYMTATETKTIQIKEGRFTKYIKRKDTQTSLDFLKNKNGTKIYENPDRLTKAKFEESIKQQLIDLYIYLGKITNIEELKAKRKEGYRTTGNFWFDRPIHSLRHIGGQWHLLKTKYNYGYVAVLGGWHTIDELKKSYGEMPPEVMDSLLEEFDY